MQLAQRRYFLTSGDKEKNTFSEQYDRVKELHRQALAAIANPERQDELNRISDALETYKGGFETVSGIISRRNDLVDNQIRPTGDEIRRLLADLEHKAVTNGNIELLQHSDAAEKHLLLSRFNYLQFIADASDEALSIAQTELTAFNNELDAISKVQTSFSQQTIVDELNGKASDYSSKIEDLVQLINEREDVRSSKLDPSTNLIFSTIRTVARDSKSDARAMSQEVQDGLSGSETGLLTTAAIALGVGLVFAVVIALGITRPVNALTVSMDRLANDDLESAIPGQGRGDEVGKMSAAVEVFKQNIIKAKQLEAEQQELKRKAEEDKRKLMMQMADEFEQQVGGIVQAVSSNSVELNASAQAMTDVSNLTLEQATQAASSSQQTTSSVQTIATATEEMTSTIAEISQQIAQASKAASEAVEKVGSTNKQMSLLSDTATSIGKVVEVISSIAEQTNLLALNATIESARAGEAGKGFAVVAGEVKQLASQTTKATEEIALQIQEVQNATNHASHSMDDVSHVIVRLNEISAAVAAAMEEQTAAINEVAGNIHQAAKGTELVNQNIYEVNKASQEAGSASSQVLASSEELAEQSSMLRAEVNKFIDQVRSA
ncbi:HAMP domain-containing methyl-accepting chemotaxis protein [uncultured Cohaesibacter sp.]|uniref:methyl-accepting chemotaxis protein n=1 Tax=uncultured Cohaesibacter sp. TaxID=1002546 RepID=UPI0029C7D538|nr:HAMP domain-containing methyl-accepting chemotaxis protein [uncultured Cohaesibacter sp.]